MLPAPHAVANKDENHGADYIDRQKSDRGHGDDSDGLTPCAQCSSTKSNKQLGGTAIKITLQSNMHDVAT